MAAYIIFDVEVTDPTAADDYLKLANESLTPFQSKTCTNALNRRGRSASRGRNVPFSPT